MEGGWQSEITNLAKVSESAKLERKHGGSRAVIAPYLHVPHPLWPIADYQEVVAALCDLLGRIICRPPYCITKTNQCGD